MTHKNKKIKYDTLIIGGGISGITACYSLLNKKTISFIEWLRTADCISETDESNDSESSDSNND